MQNPECISNTDQKGYTILDYAKYYQCSLLEHTLIHMPLTYTSQAIQKTSLVLANQHAMYYAPTALKDLKHAIYSLLSMDTAACDSESKKYCIENGWSPKKYLPIHLYLLKKLLKIENNPIKPGFIIGRIASTEMTLKLEEANDLPTALLYARFCIEEVGSITLRAGYLEPSNGHAIYIIFSCLNGIYEAKICNLGDGLEHHNYNQQTGYAPTVKFQFKTLNDLMAYFENCFTHRNKNRNEAFATIYLNGAQASPCENQCVVQYKQTTGNCVVKNLLLAHSQRLTDMGFAPQFDLIYQELLKIAVEIYKSLGGDVKELPILDKVCKAALNKELSFLTPQTCPWIRDNLGLVQQSNNKNFLTNLGTNRSYTRDHLSIFNSRGPHQPNSKETIATNYHTKKRG